MSEDSLIARLDMIEAQMRHENDLIGQRMGRLVISQSFLFGTFATLVGLRGVGTEAAGAVRLLLVLIPLVGVLLPVLVLPAVGPPTRSRNSAPSANESARCPRRSSWIGRASGTGVW